MQGVLSIEWFKNRLLPSVSIAERGRVYDNGATNPRFYYYPSLAVNRNGDVVIGFSGSSAADYVGAYFWGQLHNSVSLNSPTRYFNGKDWVNRTGGGEDSWGDYSYTTLDPDDALTVWTIQQYAEIRTSGAYTYTWGVRVTAVRPY